MSWDFAIIHGKTPRGILPVNSYVLLFTSFTVTGLSLLFLLNFVILIYNEFINSAEKGVKNGQIFQYG